MKRSITQRQLKFLIKEIKDVLEESLKENPDKGEDSVDSQIDAYFSRYESEAKNSKNEGVDFRRFMRRFLNEAGDDDKKGKEEKKDKEEKNVEKVEKISADDIDVNSFADSVVRLVDNYDSLLEMRSVILRRASNFLEKNYESDVVDSFKESLMQRHGLEAGKTKFDKDEDFQPPAADRAGATPGG